MYVLTLFSYILLPLPLGRGSDDLASALTLVVFPPFRQRVWRTESRRLMGLLSCPFSYVSYFVVIAELHM